MSRSEILRRVGWSMLAGLLIGVLVSEVSFYLLNDGTTRPPKLVQLDIPAGTAARVALGQASPKSACQHELCSWRHVARHESSLRGSPIRPVVHPGWLIGEHEPGE